jgi:hypothetical protein
MPKGFGFVHHSRTVFVAPCQTLISRFATFASLEATHCAVSSASATRGASSSGSSGWHCSKHVRFCRYRFKFQSNGFKKRTISNFCFSI